MTPHAAVANGRQHHRVSRTGGIVFFSGRKMRPSGWSRLSETRMRVSERRVYYDLLLLDGLGGRRGTAGASGEAEKTRRLNRSAALPAAITSRSMLRPSRVRRPLLTPPPRPAPRTSYTAVHGHKHPPSANEPPQSPRRTGLGRELFSSNRCRLPIRVHENNSRPHPPRLEIRPRVLRKWPQ